MCYCRRCLIHDDPGGCLNVAPRRVYADDRGEDESCQAGTPGCAIDHATDEGGCATW